MTTHLWDQAEKALEDALKHKRLDWQAAAGGGRLLRPQDRVFAERLPGPRLATAALSSWISPCRRGWALTYIAEDGSRQTPVMLHRAILGSLERFIGILIEHYAGALPLWLAPVQAVVLNITDKQAEYAEKSRRNLEKSGSEGQIGLEK